jgi:tRNA(Arg) A34 adenosine deaminase TadA
MRWLLTRAIDSIKRHCDVRSFKVIAIALRNGVPFVAETNRRADDQTQRGKFSYHAEYRLLRKMRKRGDFKRFNHITIMVLRIGDGRLRMAKPCAECSLLLSQAGVSDVCYSTPTGEIVRM